MISAGDFRKGVTFEYENNIYTIVDFQHVKPGKGSAFVRTKMKNVITGAVLEKTWNPTEKVQEAHIETKNMTYSYTELSVEIYAGFYGKYRAVYERIFTPRRNGRAFVYVKPYSVSQRVCEFIAVTRFG